MSRQHKHIGYESEGRPRNHSIDIKHTKPVAIKAHNAEILSFAKNKQPSYNPTLKKALTEKSVDVTPLKITTNAEIDMVEAKLKTLVVKFFDRNKKQVTLRIENFG